MGTQLELDTLKVRTDSGIVVQAYAFTLLVTLALILGTRIAGWVFWTSKTDEIAAVGRGLAVISGVAGVLEVLLLQVWEASTPWIVTLAAPVATLKWSAFLPAAVIATVGVLVCVGRLSRFWLSLARRGEAKAWMGIGSAVRMPTPREEAAAQPDAVTPPAHGLKRAFYRSWGTPRRQACPQWRSPTWVRIARLAGGRPTTSPRSARDSWTPRTRAIT